jgi:hypothetical protein
VSTATPPGRVLRQRVQGALVGGVAGAVFLFANAQTPLGDAAADLFRALAAANLVALIIARRRALKRPERHLTDGDGKIELFGRRWALIVVGEVAALAAGFAVIRLIDAPDQTYLPGPSSSWACNFIAFHLAGV